MRKPGGLRRFFRGRRPWALLVALLALATAWRWWLVSALPTQGFFTKYPRAVAELLAGTLAPERLGDFSPAYLALSVLMKWVGLAPRGVSLLQLASVSLAALLLAVAVRRFAGWPGAVLAALLLLGNKAALLNATELEPETVLLLLWSAALALLCRRELTARAALAGGLVMGLACVTRPASVLAVLLVGAYLWRATLLRTAVQFLAVAGGVAVLGLAPVVAQIRSPSIMDPGLVAYEGNGPLATGYAGIDPQVVTEVQGAQGVSDPIHAAYRFVEARAVGQAPDRQRANDYWRQRAVAFATRYPGAWVELVAHKVLFLLHEYDSWDIATLDQRSQELGPWFFAGFGVLTPLALAGLLFTRRVRRLGAARLLLLAALASPVVMYVSARQRNVLVPVAVFFAALGARALLRLLLRRRPVVLAWLAILVALGAALSWEYAWQREDRLAWVAMNQASALVVKAGQERDPVQRERLLARAATWNSGNDPPVSAAALREAIGEVLDYADAPTRFDAALAAQRAGAFEGMLALVQQLQEEGYRPQRGARAPSSLSYLRARAALGLGQREEAHRWLAIARTEAPADHQVLALTVVLEAGRDEAAAARAQAHLEAMYDPFTARYALAHATAAAGDKARASELTLELTARIPEWGAPAVFRAQLAGAP